MTQQGSQNVGEYGSLVSAEGSLIAQAETEAQISGEAEPDAQPESPGDQTLPEAHMQGMVRCHACGRWCGPFARQEPWQGGRYFQKKRRRNDHFKGNRGRDSPAFLR